jgi:Protein of unknown function (DUF3489)
VIAIPSPSLPVRKIVLQSLGTRVIDVMTAIPQRRNSMTSDTETTEAAKVAPAEEPKAKKKASVGAPRAHVAPKKGKSGKKTNPAKKAPKVKKGAKSKESAGPREGSKTDRILELLKRAGGVTAKELTKVTGWQPHSIRGFLSGTVGKKMGLAVMSTKGEDGERSYSVKA